MLHRTQHLQSVITLLQQFPVVSIIGARQVGKTTLAHQISDTLDQPATFFDLEDPRDLARLQNPISMLEQLEGLIILDEIQRKPDLFPVLRVLSDRTANSTRFLVLGSSSPDLLRQSAESLARRIAYHPLGGLNLQELDHQPTTETLRKLWIRGGFPRSLLATDEPTSLRWRNEFIQTHLERDLPALGIRLSPTTMHRFWSMLAHYHGQVWNGSELARALGITEKSVKHYLEILASTFMVRIVQPWHINLKKRQVKAPKIYIRDSGLLHALLNIETFDNLYGHPKVGASWEGFALEQIVQQLPATTTPYFWALHSGGEVDLYFQLNQKKIGIEFKLNESPTKSRSMHSAITNLELDHLYIIYPGESRYPLSDKIEAIPLNLLLEELNNGA